MGALYKLSRTEAIKELNVKRLNEWLPKRGFVLPSYEPLATYKSR